MKPWANTVHEIVEIVTGAGVVGQRVDDGAAQTGLCRGERKGRAVEATADDEDIAIMFHAGKYAPLPGIVHALRCRYRRRQQERA